MNCPNCGDPISEDQRFCEKCGTELRSVKVTTRKDEATKPKPIALESSNLFDLNRMYYLIHERAWDMGYGDIMDEEGKLIGRMNRILFSIRRRVELQELDGTVVATIHSKIVSARGAQDCRRPHGAAARCPVPESRRALLRPDVEQRYGNVRPGTAGRPERSIRSFRHLTRERP